MLEKSREDWLAERDELEQLLDEFSDVMRRRPFDNREGLRGVSAFALYYFLKRLQPAVVLEVGVWRGFSTWLIEQAVPDAEVHCFDPIFFLQRYIKRRALGTTYRSARATYRQEEFSCADLSDVIVPDKTVAFFDDHQWKMARVRQCRELGILDVVFDDNTPYVSTHRTLQNDLDDPAARPAVEAAVERYDVFPALWDVDHRMLRARIRELGLGGFEVTPERGLVHADRKWHSYVTYVRLAALTADR